MIRWVLNCSRDEGPPVLEGTAKNGRGAFEQGFKQCLSIRVQMHTAVRCSKRNYSRCDRVLGTHKQYLDHPIPTTQALEPENETVLAASGGLFISTTSPSSVGCCSQQRLAHLSSGLSWGLSSGLSIVCRASPSSAVMAAYVHILHSTHTNNATRSSDDGIGGFGGIGRQ